MKFITTNSNQINFSEQELNFLNNFSNIDEAVNFCKGQVIAFSEELKKLKKIKEELARRSLEELEGLQHRYPNVASLPVPTLGVPASIYNKFVVSEDNLTPYEKSEEADTILAHELRSAGLGALIGSGLGAGAGAIIGGPAGYIAPIAGGVGGLIAGGVLGAHKGAKVAKKRREQLLKALA